MKAFLSKLKARLSARRGMTLVEVVVSIGLLGLLTVFVMMVFVTSLRVVSGNAEYKKGGKDAAAGIENEIAGESVSSEIAAVDRQGGEFFVTFGGTVIEAEGEIVEGKDRENGITYRYFEPGAE